MSATMPASIGTGPLPGSLPAGVTRKGEGTAWNILGHTYWLKASSENAFAFETYDPPGTFVPPHVHPTQDEFIWVMEGAFDLYLDGTWTKAGPGDLVCMPKGLVHAYYNRGDVAARALFWVTPGRRLKELFDALHDLTDPEEVVRRSAACEVDFLPPGAVPGA
ncbi:cupin domain-containing protein [Roseomonas sp. CCTCC AB2023176]|uniref:cupin domain-containing protein n=1 Tax=Roseomonas sp. CCTCC AB2023176 TaxID=3342640 RepID=UPI0035E187AD